MLPALNPHNNTVPDFIFTIKSPSGFGVYLYSANQQNSFAASLMFMIWFLSVLIIGLSIYRLYTYTKKVKSYYKTSAVIVGNDIKKVDDALMGAKYFYAPIVEFTDRDGTKKQMVCGEDNPSRPLYKDGATLTLLVHPDDSSRFLVYDFIGGYVIPVIWIIIGVTIVVIPYSFPDTFK